LSVHPNPTRNNDGLTRLPYKIEILAEETSCDPNKFAKLFINHFFISSTSSKPPPFPLAIQKQNSQDYTMARPDPNLITKALQRDRLPLETWIAIGAFVQILLTLLLPLPLAIAPAIFFGAGRLALYLLMYFKIIHDPSLDEVQIGRFSAQIPDEKGNFSKTGSDRQIVVFILGTKCNHILGKSAPGYHKIGDYFMDMAIDLAKNPETSGCLGMTAPMLSTVHETMNISTTITYWRDIESLHKWAAGNVHRPAEIWWAREGKDYMGIFHETYVVPKGSWETIYHNMEPFGLGSMKAVIEGEDGVKSSVGFLRETKGKEWSSMLARMSRPEVDTKEG